MANSNIFTNGSIPWDQGLFNDIIDATRGPEENRNQKELWTGDFQRMRIKEERQRLQQQLIRTMEQYAAVCATHSMGGEQEAQFVSDAIDYIKANDCFPTGPGEDDDWTLSEVLGMLAQDNVEVIALWRMAQGEGGQSHYTDQSSFKLREFKMWANEKLEHQKNGSVYEADGTVEPGKKYTLRVDDQIVEVRHELDYLRIYTYPDEPGGAAKSQVTVVRLEK